MTIHILEIPETAASRRDWLERHLIGPDLLELVAELKSMSDVDCDKNSHPLEQLFPHLPAALEQGLSALPDDEITYLLSHPESLIELQEAIYFEGGRYWIRLIAASVQEDPQQAWPVIAGSTISFDSIPVVAAPSVSMHLNRRTLTRTFFGLLATAAVVLVAFWFQPSTKTTVTWGWARPGALQLEGSPDEYLRHLASSAEEWFQDRPQTSLELAQRIQDFEAGCHRLLAAKHQHLDLDDRAWLLDRCQNWSTTFTTLRNDLLTGSKGSKVVQLEMDAAVVKLVTAIRQRAATLG